MLFKKQKNYQQIVKNLKNKYKILKNKKIYKKKNKNLKNAYKKITKLIYNLMKYIIYYKMKAYMIKAIFIMMTIQSIYIDQIF